MIDEFWFEGASLFIYAAHEAEVAPFLKRCDLKRINLPGQGMTYAHPAVDLRVTINGESGVSGLLTTGLALAEASEHTRHLLIGASGHASFPVGQWYHPSALNLDGIKGARTLYPSLEGARQFESSVHITRYEFSAHYPEDGGVDLESYSWFQALSRQINVDSIGILRLVSDTPNQPVESPGNFRSLEQVLASAWTESWLDIAKWFQFHAKRSAQWRSRERVEKLPPELQRFRWSQTQLHQIRRCLERARLLQFDLDEFYARVHPLKSRKELLTQFEQELNGTEVDLNG